ncbi:hypothetical protein N9V60_01985, partial [Flavobacteriaceae bacterium]|nr:hypothetical protein [Flavobacteriaceae bacterium]
NIGFVANMLPFEKKKIRNFIKNNLLRILKVPRVGVGCMFTPCTINQSLIRNSTSLIPIRIAFLA